MVIGGSLKWNSLDAGDLSKLHIRKPFNGYIDEVAFFGQSLDGDQIKRLMTAGPLSISESATEK
jgi:hypothetical protein